jgi:hypothetical protein
MDGLEDLKEKMKSRKPQFVVIVSDEQTPDLSILIGAVLGRKQILVTTPSDANTFVAKMAHAEHLVGVPLLSICTIVPFEFKHCSDVCWQGATYNEENKDDPNKLMSFIVMVKSENIANAMDTIWPIYPWMMTLISWGDQHMIQLVDDNKEAVSFNITQSLNEISMIGKEAKPDDYC